MPGPQRETDKQKKARLKKEREALAATAAAATAAPATAARESTLRPRRPTTVLGTTPTPAAPTPLINRPILSPENLAEYQRVLLNSTNAQKDLRGVMDRLTENGLDGEGELDDRFAALHNQMRDVYTNVGHLMEAVEALTAVVTKVAEIDLTDKLPATPPAESLVTSPGITVTLRTLADDADATQQRSLKGSIVMSSPTGGGKSSEIKTDAVLTSEGSNLFTHTADLIKRKYGVVIVEADLTTIHRLGGGVLLRFASFMPNSNWDKLCRAIKTKPTGETLNMFLSFHLTQRRNSLFWNVRQLHREKRIAKFFSDENGAISIIKCGEEDKLKVTTASQKPINGVPQPATATMTVDELLNLTRQE